MSKITQDQFSMTTTVKLCIVQPQHVMQVSKSQRTRNKYISAIKLLNISFQRWMKCQIMNMLHMEWEMINTRKENFAMAKKDDKGLCLPYRTNALFYAKNTLRKLTSDIALTMSSKDSDLQPVRPYHPC